MLAIGSVQSDWIRFDPIRYDRVASLLRCVAVAVAAAVVAAVAGAQLCRSGLCWQGAERDGSLALCAAQRDDDSAANERMEAADGCWRLAAGGWQVPVPLLRPYCKRKPKADESVTARQCSSGTKRQPVAAAAFHSHSPTLSCAPTSAFGRQSKAKPARNWVSNSFLGSSSAGCGAGNGGSEPQSMSVTQRLTCRHRRRRRCHCHQADSNAHSDGVRKSTPVSGWLAAVLL